MRIELLTLMLGYWLNPMIDKEMREGFKKFMVMDYYRRKVFILLWWWSALPIIGHLFTILAEVYAKKIGMKIDI